MVPQYSVSTWIRFLGLSHRAPQWGTFNDRNLTLSEFWKLEVSDQGVSGVGSFQGLGRVISSRPLSYLLGICWPHLWHFLASAALP